MRSALVVGGLLALLASCGIGEGGIGLPHQRAGETYPGNRLEMVGILEVADNSCLNMALDGTSYLVIWPAGSALADRVLLPNGEVIAEGDTVVGTGAFTPTARLTADRNGYWANAIGYCAPDASEVVVLDTARRGG